MSLQGESCLDYDGKGGAEFMGMLHFLDSAAQQLDAW